MKEKTRVVYIPLTLDEHGELAALAKEEDRTVGQMARAILRKALRQQQAA